MLALIDVPTMLAIAAAFILCVALIALIIERIVEYGSNEARLGRLVKERTIKREETARRERLLKGTKNSDSPLAELYKLNIAFLEKEIAELEVRIESLRCEIEMKKLGER